MNEKTKDSGDGAEDRRFSPTDWDWAMLLSGEINAIETRFDTFSSRFIGVLSESISRFSVIIMTLSLITIVIIAVLEFSYSNSTNLDSNFVMVVIIGIVVTFFIYIVKTIFDIYRIYRDYNKRKREYGDRAKLLRGCRDELFDRLDDPNKIYEHCFKKGDENK